MKTLIFNGSPRPDGDTMSLIRILTGDADGEKKKTTENEPRNEVSGNFCEKPLGESPKLRCPAALTGEYRLANAYCADIAPCVDCRWCWKHEGCKMNDGMQEIYEYMKECDNILIASPIHFSELSGQLLALLSRLQALYCARTFQNTELIAKPKRGAILLAGGGDGRPERACTTARILLRTMNCRSILEPVISHQTNERPAVEDAEAVRGVKKIAEFFAGGLERTL